jgi:GntR family transcriptional repressor for pyruvate dehydrogenase complex
MAQELASDRAAAPSPEDGRPRRPRKMAEIVAREILAHVLTSGMQPGDRLPAESVMLRQYDIARSTMREALRILEVYGVLTIRSGPGGGPVLSDMGPREIAQTVQLFLSAKRVALGDVWGSLQLLHALLARQAAVAGDAGQLAALRENLAQEPTDDRREYNRLVTNFHQTMADVPGGRLLRVMVEVLEEIMVLQVGKRVDIASAMAYFSDRKGIAEAVFAGDAEEAARLTVQHSERVTKLLRRSVPGALERPVEWT